MRGTAITLLGQWTRFVLQAASLSVLARLLTPADYGLVAMVTAIVGIAAVIGDFGLSLAAIRSRDLTSAQKSNLFWLNALVGVSIGVIILLSAEPIAAFYHRQQLADIVRVLASIFVINGLLTQFQAELTRALKFGRLAVVDVTAQLVGFTVAFVSAYEGAGYWALAAQQAAVAITTLVMAALLSGWWPGLPSTRTGMGTFLTFGANTMGVQSVTYLSNNVDSILVGRYWGSAPLGIYNRAFDLFTLPMIQLASPLTRVVLPILSRVEDDETFRRYLGRAQLVLTYGLIGAFALAAAVAQPLIAVVLGPHWAHVVPIFQVLAVGGVFQALSYVYYWAFLAKGKMSIQLRGSIIGRLLMMLAIFIGVHFSTLGAAAGSAFGLFVMWLILTWWGMPKAGIPVARMNLESARAVALFVAIFAVDQGLLRVLPASVGSVTRLGLGVSAAAACVALAAVVLPPIRRDLTIVLSSVRLLANRTR